MNVQNPTPVINLTINGVALQAREGQTLLDVARAHHIRIPTLCFLEGLSSVGACRLCLVEIKGIPRLLPACTTAAAEGMQVETDSVRLRKHRKRIIELLFAERNHVCAICVSNGRCELQALAQELGVTHTPYRYRFAPYALDASHHRFVHDPNRCILCTRCVRVCAEVEGAHTWDIKGRGILSDLTSDLDTPWGESDSCTSCGKCVQVCPTGALFEKGRATGEMAKRHQFLSCLSDRRALR